jgi:hypothetical protein
MGQWPRGADAALQAAPQWACAAPPAPLPEASGAPSDQDEAPPPAAIAASIEDFLLRLPLGSGRAAAEVEAAVSQRLLESELSRVQMRQRLKKW